MSEGLQILSPQDVWREVGKVMTKGCPGSDYRAILDVWLLINLPPLDPDDVCNMDGVVSRIASRGKGELRALLMGGFDFGFNHFQILSLLAYLLPPNCKVVLGVESDGYIQAKRREPVFPQMYRLAAMAMMLKEKGILAVAFPIPPRKPGVGLDDFYDNVVREIGMYREPGCYHLYTKGDPHASQKRARMLVPERWCELPAIGSNNRPISVSELLTMRRG